MKLGVHLTQLFRRCLKILMNSLDPDQAQKIFVPELGLNRL